MMKTGFLLLDRVTYIVFSEHLIKPTLNRVKTITQVNFFLQCVPISGRGFEAGGYKCECLQGYEYPFEDPITYYDGQIVEAEFQNIIADKETRIDMFKCRLAGAAAIQSSVVMLCAVLFVAFRLR